MPYTPTPVMDIAYPQSPLNQFVTAQKEIKKEKQADQLFEQKAKEAELAYKEAEINLATAQQKQADSQRLQALDRKAGQMYNSILASGGKRSDAIRAVNGMLAIEGGYEVMMNNQKELDAQLTKALTVANINPQAAALAADFINATQPEDAPQVTPEQVYQSTQKKSDFNIGDGRIVTWNQQKGEYETIDRRDAEQKAAAQRKEKLEEYKARTSRMSTVERNEISRLNAARQMDELERKRQKDANDLDYKYAALESKEFLKLADLSSKEGINTARLKNASKIAQMKVEATADLKKLDRDLDYAKLELEKLKEQGRNNRTDKVLEQRIDEAKRNYGLKERQVKTQEQRIDLLGKQFEQSVKEAEQAQKNVEAKRSDAQVSKRVKRAQDAVDDYIALANPKTSSNELAQLFGSSPAFGTPERRTAIEAQGNQTRILIEQLKTSDPEEAARLAEQLASAEKTLAGSGRLSNLWNKHSTPGAQAPAPQSTAGKATDTLMGIANPLYAPYATYNLLKGE